MSSSAIGVILPIIGGILNSSWNIPTREDSPTAFKIQGWQWENTWLAKSTFSVAFNACYVCAVIGTSKLSSIYDVATSEEIGLVCIFSALWSVGILSFGIGQKLAGVAVGISLSMSLLVVIGTLLPLVIDSRDEIGSTQSMVNFLGVLLAVMGFCACAKASGMKDSALKAKSRELNGASAYSIQSNPSAPHAQNHGAKTINSRADLLEYGETKADPEIIHSPDDAAEKKKFYIGVMVCIMCAIFSACLQAAFVFGKPIVDEAKHQGVAGANSPLVIWLFGYTLGSGGCMIYSLYLLFKQKSWHKFLSVGAFDNLKNTLLAAMMAFSFVTHIHLYGMGQSFLGDLGPAIAWPMIMSSTVLFGQVWGMYLKEWTDAPKPAVRMNALSFGLLILAVTVIAIASFI